MISSRELADITEVFHRLKTEPLHTISKILNQQSIPTFLLLTQNLGDQDMDLFIGGLIGISQSELVIISSFALPTYYLPGAYFGVEPLPLQSTLPQLVQHNMLIIQLAIALHAKKLAQDQILLTMQEIVSKVSSIILFGMLVLPAHPHIRDLLHIQMWPSTNGSLMV